MKTILNVVFAFRSSLFSVSIEFWRRAGSYRFASCHFRPIVPARATHWL